MKRLSHVGRAGVVIFLVMSCLLLAHYVGAQSESPKEPAASAEERAGPNSSAGRVEPAPIFAESVEEGVPDWQARWELARLLSYSKRYAEALTEYEKLLKEKPDLWQAKVEMASVLFWNNQPERAVEVFEQIPRDQMNDAARMALADLYVAQKEYAKAEELTRAYLERFPEDQSVRLKLADILSYQKRYEDSIKQYELILKARPDDMQVRRKYALVLSWAGHRERAITELQKTLK
jgi:tetratricopeptide (TPR) repeat protein